VVLDLSDQLLANLGFDCSRIIVFGKSRNAALPLITVLAVYPLIFYASQVVSRYRHPIDPVLYALSGVALSRIVSRVAVHHSRRSI